MIHVYCLTKTYNETDIKTWLKYYSALHVKIHIIDNDSTIDLESVSKEFNDIDYSKISGWPNQYHLYETILKSSDFADDDCIIFLDDDEYLWYNRLAYSSLEEAINDHFRQLDSLLIPEILMSTKHLKESRDDSYINFCTYRRNDLSSQGKAIIRFRKDTKYKFTKKNAKEIGHVPWINNIRMSDVVGSGVSKTTYGLTKPEADLRLYHYHIKTKADWEIKIARGSAAVIGDEKRTNGSYDADIKKDLKYGDYTVPDFAVKNFFESI